MLFDKYGEYHKEQKKEWQIDKGIKRGCSIIRIYCIVFSLAVAAFIIRTAISVKQEYLRQFTTLRFETIEGKQGDGTATGGFFVLLKGAEDLGASNRGLNSPVAEHLLMLDFSAEKIKQTPEYISKVYLKYNFQGNRVYKEISEPYFRDKMMNKLNIDSTNILTDDGLRGIGGRQASEEGRLFFFVEEGAQNILCCVEISAEEEGADRLKYRCIIPVVLGDGQEGGMADDES